MGTVATILCFPSSRKHKWTSRTIMSCTFSGCPRRPRVGRRRNPRGSITTPAKTKPRTPWFRIRNLVHLDRAKDESGADLKRQNLPENLYTGIWWYARFPNHYSSDGSVATQELGQWNMKGWIDSIVECIRSVKADEASLKIQNEVYETSKHPL